MHGTHLEQMHGRCMHVVPGAGRAQMWVKLPLRTQGCCCPLTPPLMVRGSHNTATGRSQVTTQVLISPFKTCALKEHAPSYPNLSLAAQPHFLISHYPDVSRVPADPMTSCPAQLSCMQTTGVPTTRVPVVTLHHTTEGLPADVGPVMTTEKRKLPKQGLPGGKEFPVSH